jgi:hypothetical protein
MQMGVKTYNFQNPELQQMASRKARVSPRPRTYNSKRKRVQEVQKELIREELLKEGFVQQLGTVLPQINDALIASALQPTSAGASDRRIIYTALKIIAKERENESQETMGQIISDLMKS